MKQSFSREELIKLFEVLIDQGTTYTTESRFRDLLDRDQKLYVNQITRKATTNIAYRKVDADVTSMSDAEFWAMVDRNDYSDLIEENAATNIVSMVNKLKLV